MFRKREPTRIWGETFDRHTFPTIRKVKWDKTFAVSRVIVFTILKRLPEQVQSEWQ